MSGAYDSVFGAQLPKWREVDGAYEAEDPKGNTWVLWFNPKEESWKLMPAAAPSEIETITPSGGLYAVLDIAGKYIVTIAS